MSTVPDNPAHAAAPALETRSAPPTVADLYDHLLDEAARRPRAADVVTNAALSRAVVAHGVPVVLRLDETDCVVLTSDGGPVTRQPARFATAQAPGKAALEATPAPEATPNPTEAT